MNELSYTLTLFLGGMIVGGLLVWLLLPSRSSRQLEQQAKRANKELDDYRKQVDTHFIRTAGLVDDMTKAYQAVHEELAQGAQSLCSEDSQQLVIDKTDLMLTTSAGKTPSNPSQPLDYAPKSQGTLAEDFGLAKANEQQPEATHSAPSDYLKSNDKPSA